PWYVYLKHCGKSTEKKRDDLAIAEGLKNLVNLLVEKEIDATFFVVAEHVEKAPELYYILVDSGFEIGNHSYSHPFPFTNLTRDEKEKEIYRAHEIIEDLLGVTPIGFRAPAYSIDLETLEILESLEYRYDSSVVPSYYPGLIPFKSIFGPLSPYYPSKRGLGKKEVLKVLEIPISVNPFVRLPISSVWLQLLGMTWLRLSAKLLLKLNKDLILLFHARDGLKELPVFDGANWYIYLNRDKLWEVLIDALDFVKECTTPLTYKEYIKHVK
ncbi:MAG: polysaccharide deacetylase family protein, partial [Methanocellales archaeon]|nr:polysaccharide deacetylase family protein [Methanocellales archaeon]